MVKRLLFICTGNTCRSPMAQAILVSILGHNNSNIIIESAGLFATNGMPATPEAIAVMEDFGIDLSGHRSRQVTGEMVQQADLVLTMTGTQRDWLVDMYPQAEGKTFTISEYLGEEGDLNDPFGQGGQVYRESANQIRKLLNQLAVLLRHPEGNKP